MTPEKMILTFDQLELFADCDSELAENPLWNEAEQTLYWRGHQGEIYWRKDDGTSPNRYCVDSPGVGKIGGFVFTADNWLLLFADFGRIWQWKPGIIPNLIATLPDACEGTLLNDAIVAPDGSVYFGVLADYYFDPPKRASHGSMRQLKTNGEIVMIEPDAGITPNGMAFSPDRTRFYFGITDQGVYEYRFEAGRCILSGRRLLFDATPDGLTTDVEGHIWTTHSQPILTCHSPEGKLLKNFFFPPAIHGISSVTFGGSDYFSIFITSMNYPYSKEYFGGKVFRIPAMVHGCPEFRARLFF